MSSSQILLPPEARSEKDWLRQLHLGEVAMFSETHSLTPEQMKLSGLLDSLYQQAEFTDGNKIISRDEAMKRYLRGEPIAVLPPLPSPPR